MSYYPDLSDYTYRIHPLRKPTKTRTLNIGWLDDTHAFPSGSSTDKFLKSLWELCKVRVTHTRGIHDCELCKTFGPELTVERGQERLHLRSAEIRVFGTAGIVYAAPNLVYHYVKAHRYQPPEEFIRAVEQTHITESYFDLLRDLELIWDLQVTELES